MICQLDGNESVEESLDGYDSDDDVDSGPVRAVLVPAQQQPGQQFTLDVGDDSVQAPSNLPLIMVANFCSAYNKENNTHPRRVGEQPSYTTRTDFKQLTHRLECQQGLRLSGVS